jgi:uncharacterized tellurite resistance protein B-like protein
MSILTWLGFDSAPAPAARREDDVVRAIVQQLEAMEPARARFLALFAFLLARVANVDLEIGEEETRRMEGVLQEWGGLTPAQSALAVQIAKSQNQLFGETQNFLVAREFRDRASPEEKQALLHSLFAVAAADETITVPEEESIRQISRELLLTNDEYLGIRTAYSEKRAVMKRQTPPPGSP